MGEVKDLVRRWEKSRKATRTIAAAIPAGKEDFRPAPETVTLGQQVLHVASGEKMVRDALTVTRGKWEWNTGIDLEHYSKTTDILAVLDRETEATRGYLTGLADTDLATLIKWPWGESTLGDLWYDGIFHEIHHRGCLVTGLRVAGVTAPKIW